MQTKILEEVVEDVNVRRLSLRDTLVLGAIFVIVFHPINLMNPDANEIA